MDMYFIIVAIITVTILLVIGGFLGVAFTRRQRTKRLKQKFGPEYKHTLHEMGGRGQAEEELDARLDRVKTLEIRALSEGQRENFAYRWRSTQAKFVDQPIDSIYEADRLIKEIMLAKGYPLEDFEQRAADISVDYPDLVVSYRGMREIVTRSEHEQINTEEMRQAMLHSRDLYEKLLGKKLTEYPYRKVRS